MTDLLIIQVIAAIIYASLWYLAAQRLRRYDVADIAWGLGFIYLMIIARLSGNNLSLRGLWVQLFVTLWGLRLSLYIFFRNRGKPEDPRYRKWRNEWGTHAAIRAFLQLFLFQGILMVIILIPATYVLEYGGPDLKWLDVAGAAVFLCGFVAETVADFQKYRFKSNPLNRGRFISAGLWKYSRHPNYFGEVTFWWGIWLTACSVSGGWLTIWGPITITCLILFVSGIPLLEKRYEGNREYEAYKRRTSAFFPLPTKR